VVLAGASAQGLESPGNIGGAISHTSTITHIMWRVAGRHGSSLVATATMSTSGTTASPFCHR
jgi:hypothetical protein